MATLGFDADSAVGFCATCPGNIPSDCRAERREIEKKCGPSKSENKRFVKGRERYNNRKVRKGRTRNTVQVRNMTWKDEHCGAALMQVNASNIKERMDELSDLTDTMFNDITDYAVDLGLDIAQERLTRWGAATAGRYAASGLCTAVGPAGTAVCAAAATVTSVVSGLWNLFSGGREIIRATRQVNEMIDQLSVIRNNAEAVLKAAESPDALKDVQRSLSEAMEVAAAADPCLSARKCYLVPYNPPSNSNPQGPAAMNQGGSGSPGLFDRGPMDLSDSRGCCPGQTGHHLIPKAMLQHCASYTDAMHNKAPVVCAEGANHSMGSHGKLHTAMDRYLRENHSKGQPMTMQDAIDAAAYSHDETVGKGCRPECIKEQLERFYKDIACAPMAVNKLGKPIYIDRKESGI